MNNIDAQILKRAKKDLYCKVTKEAKEIWIQVRALDRVYRLTIVKREQVDQKPLATPDASSADTATTATVIHEAAKKGSLKMIKAFLSKGEKVNAKDKHGLTPLFHAASKGHKDICELVISKGTDINAKGYQNKTPLHMVGCTEICDLLISKGADVNAKDNQGLTPLHQALKNNRKDVAAILRKHGGVK